MDTICRFLVKNTRVKTHVPKTFVLRTGSGGMLKVYKTSDILAGNEPQALPSLESRMSAPTVISFSPDNNFMLVSYKKARPQILDLRAKKMKNVLECKHEIRSFVFTANNTRLLAAGPYYISQWRWPLLSSLPTVEFDDEDRSSNICVSEDGGEGVSITDNVLFEDGFWRIPELLRLDFNKGTITNKFRLENEKKEYATFYQLKCVDFKARKATLVDYAAGTHKEQKAFAMEYSLTDGSLQHFAQIDRNEAGAYDCNSKAFIVSARIAPQENDWRITESGDYKAEITGNTVVVTRKGSSESWRINTFAEPLTRDTSNYIEIMNFSPDKKQLIIGTRKGEIGFYDIRSGKLLSTYIYLGYGEWIWFTPDGNYNASKNGTDLVVKTKIQF